MTRASGFKSGQPRDAMGRWTSSGGGGKIASSMASVASKKKAAESSYDRMGKAAARSRRAQSNWMNAVAKHGKGSPEAQKAFKSFEKLDGLAVKAAAQYSASVRDFRKAQKAAGQAKKGK